MTTLTQCQQQVLDMLISYQKERGFPPTNQEVATMLGYRSVNAAVPKLNSSWEPVYQVTFPDGSTDVLSQEDTRFGPGQAIVTPAVIKGELLTTYRQLERAGIVENYELFKQYLVVERDASDPNRLNTLFPPDYVNQLRVFAVVNQFRLQYSEESA